MGEFLNQVTKWCSSMQKQTNNKQAFETKKQKGATMRNRQTDGETDRHADRQIVRHTKTDRKAEKPEEKKP